jgi:STAND-like protein
MTSSSPNFQLIFNNALEAYRKRTRKDLLTHPLFTQLQNCNSPNDVLSLINRQVQGLHQSQRDDEKLTRWLDPTVRVLYTFSETLGEGVSLVCIRK